MHVEARARCQAEQQWIKAFYRRNDHLPRVQADLTDCTCTVETQRETAKQCTNIMIPDI